MGERGLKECPTQFWEQIITLNIWLKTGQNTKAIALQNIGFWTGFFISWKELIIWHTTNQKVPDPLKTKREPQTPQNSPDKAHTASSCKPPIAAS